MEGVNGLQHCVDKVTISTVWKLGENLSTTVLENRGQGRCDRNEKRPRPQSRCQHRQYDVAGSFPCTPSQPVSNIDGAASTAVLIFLEVAPMERQSLQQMAGRLQRPDIREAMACVFRSIMEMVCRLYMGTAANFCLTRAESGEKDRQLHLWEDW